MAQTARWFALLCLTLGCGGKVEEATPDAPAPTTPPPAARPTMSPPTTAGTMTPPPPTATATGTLPEPTPSTPDETCPELALDLSFDEGELGKNGIAVELVQKPEFTEATQGTMGEPPLPPDEWDHSDVPEGACVFRLRGVPASCYAHIGSSLMVGLPCDAPQVPPFIVPVSFYEMHACDGITPGCAGPEWLYSRDDYAPWYLSQQGDDTFVIFCARQCHDIFHGTDVGGGASCLWLTPRTSDDPTCR
jgi:hypothetical protein